MLRLLAVLGIGAAVVVIAYAAARYTSLFALEELEIAGGPPAVREAVREAGAPFLGDSLVGLDQDEVRRRLAALPSVRAVTVDRASSSPSARSPSSGTAGKPGSCRSGAA